MLDLEDSALRRDRITEARLEHLIPGLMDDADIDCWILIPREYAEDPVAQTMLPAKWMSSRRTLVPEWDDSVAIMVEEEAWYEGETATWVDGRQTEIWGI